MGTFYALLDVRNACVDTIMCVYDQGWYGPCTVTKLDFLMDSMNENAFALALQQHTAYVG